MTTTKKTDRDIVCELRDRAFALGAADSYDDCIGGDVYAPEGCSAACREAVQAYKRAAMDLHRNVHGPMLREYYFGRPI